MKKENVDVTSLAHTKWDCKYHIVFAPKYRRKVFYEDKRLEIREILRKLCEWKGVEIVEGEVCPDHIHMLVEIPPKMIEEYIQNQLKEDLEYDQMSLKEYIDPFTGEPVKKNKK